MAPGKLPSQWVQTWCFHTRGHRVPRLCFAQTRHELGGRELWGEGAAQALLVDAAASATLSGGAVCERPLLLSCVSPGHTR